MALSYKCLAKEIILKDLRNIRYAEGAMLFGFNNTKELTLELDVDVLQISLQADVFAREIITHRSKFDLKRILGPFQVDWLRLLHEAYVYDRIKCIYYGLQSYNLLQLPDNTYSFPGNIMLMNLLIKKNFQFSTGDQQKYSLYVNLKYKNDIQEILKPIFDVYPDLKEGMSDTPNIVSYVNIVSETILKGLYNAKDFLKSKNKNSESLFEIVKMNDSNIEQFLVEDSNPIINSFLEHDGTKFYFILPYDKSNEDALRFNESLFLSRAIGFRSSQLTEGENNFYSVAKRDNVSDYLTREDVYSITGLKSEIIPLSSKQIEEYLGINSFKAEVQKVKEANGDSNNP